MEGKGGEWNQWEGKNVGTVTFRRLFRKRVGFWVKRPSNPPRIGPPLFGFNIISLRPMRHEQADGERRSPQIVVLILLIFPPLLLLFRHSPFPSLGHMFLSLPATPPFFFFHSVIKCILKYRAGWAISSPLCIDTLLRGEQIDRYSHRLALKLLAQLSSDANFFSLSLLDYCDCINAPSSSFFSWRG